jgi:hypothetical protein
VPVDYKWQQIVTEEILGLEIAKCRRKRKIVKELNKPSNLIVMKVLFSEVYHLLFP